MKCTVLKGIFLGMTSYIIFGHATKSYICETFVKCLSINVSEYKSLLITYRVSAAHADTKGGFLSLRIALPVTLDACILSSQFERCMVFTF